MVDTSRGVSRLVTYCRLAHEELEYTYPLASKFNVQHSSSGNRLVQLETCDLT